MQNQKEHAPRVEALERLMENLCNPDLTLGEAKSLRGHLFELLETNRQECVRERVAVPAPHFAVPTLNVKRFLAGCCAPRSLCPVY
ncbi:hypothetical protein ACYOEI_33480 [Singulisphaera rosea]